MTVASIDILEQADLERIFWIEFNILSCTFSRSGYDALLSRIHLHFRSRVGMRMSYEFIPMQAS